MASHLSSLKLSPRSHFGIETEISSIEVENESSASEVKSESPASEVRSESPASEVRSESPASEVGSESPASEVEDEFDDEFLEFEPSTSEDDLESTVIEVDVEPPVVDVDTPIAEQLQVNENITATMADADNLKVEFNTVTEDLEDFFDENPVADISKTVEDHDLINKEVEQLRSMYRGKHNQLKPLLAAPEYEQEIKPKYDINITKLKNYIKTLKENRRTLRKGEEDASNAKSSVMDRKFHFLNTEITQKITRLENMFTLDSEKWKAESDENVEKRIKELPDRSKEVQSLLSSIKDLMDCSTGVTDGATTVGVQESNFGKLCDI